MLPAIDLNLANIAVQGRGAFAGVVGRNVQGFAVLQENACVRKIRSAYGVLVGCRAHRIESQS